MSFSNSNRCGMNSAASPVTRGADICSTELPSRGFFQAGHGAQGEPATGYSSPTETPGFNLLARRALRWGLLAILVAAGFKTSHGSTATGQTFQTVSAYCSCRICCGDWSQFGETASGAKPRAGITIAAPRSVPMGTRVYVAGLGWRVVQDRLARRHDDRWDVFVSTHEQARRFGVRRVRITTTGGQ